MVLVVVSSYVTVVVVVSDVLCLAYVVVNDGNLVRDFLLSCFLVYVCVPFVCIIAVVVVIGVNFAVVV